MDKGLVLRIDDRYLNNLGYLGGFQAQSKTVILRSDATLFEAIHEMGHANFFSKIGSNADDYLKFGEAGRELEAWRFVLDYNERFPRRFSAEELSVAKKMYNEEFCKLFGASK